MLEPLCRVLAQAETNGSFHFPGQAFHNFAGRPGLLIENLTAPVTVATTVVLSFSAVVYLAGKMVEMKK